MPELRASDAALRADLGLTVEALGRLPPVSAAGVTLANEQDGANRNYAVFTNIPGTHGALAQVRIHDPSGAWSDSGKMWVGRTSGGTARDQPVLSGGRRRDRAGQRDIRGRRSRVVGQRTAYGGRQRRGVCADGVGEGRTLHDALGVHAVRPRAYRDRFVRHAARQVQGSGQGANGFGQR